MLLIFSCIFWQVAVSLGLLPKSGFNFHTVIWTVCVWWNPQILCWIACTIPGEPAHRTALARRPFSQAHVHTTPPIAIKTKTRGVTWMVNRTHTVWIIQMFEILKWQLFFQNAFVGFYSSAPSPKWTQKIPQHVGCNSMIACQVSWISDKFWIY